MFFWKMGLLLCFEDGALLVPWEMGVIGSRRSRFIEPPELSVATYRFWLSRRHPDVLCVPIDISAGAVVVRSQLS